MEPRRIKPLPALLVNQIAAGEVVERPASVVKELVENALDAGATRVAVDLEAGGIELVRVSDDGSGIAAGDLPLAIAPHATSKIDKAEDLDRIATMGFRGEALASVASVSRLSIRSRTAGAEAASLIEVEGTAGEVPRPAPGPVGTVVAVRNLFFNTPARRKFLRTPHTEQQRCVEVVEALAMANPAVGFALSCDGRAHLDLPSGQSPKERVLAVLGKELAGQLVEVHADRFDDSRGLALWGVAGTPALARATNKSQHIFLNGRPIRDKTIQHALREGYRGLIDPSRHPTAVLMLEMDPGAVDVNVHPAKAEVRFRDSSLVHSVVLRAVREALTAADLTPSIGGPGVRFGEDRAILPPVPAVETTAFVDYFRREIPAQAGGRISYDAIREALSAGGAPLSAPAVHPPGALPMASPSPMVGVRPATRVLQVHNSFLLSQDEQGVVIIDQHALHERVMFEQLLSRVAAGNLESQRLLTPAVVPASPAQIDSLAALAPLLGRIGIEAAPMGPTTVAVQAFPTFLFDRGVDPVQFMAALLEKSEGDGFSPGDEGALHEVLDMMACKAAVKAGDHMSDEELAELVRMREEIERSGSCPHGRPTSVRLTIRELEKLFHRR